MNGEVLECMEQARRNAVGRLVVHAEADLKLELSTPERLEAMYPRQYRDQAEWLSNRLEEVGGPRYTSGWFGFDDGPAWPGMHDGSTWNGWAKPHFSKEVADGIISFFNEQVPVGTPCSCHDGTEDAYLLAWEVAEKGDEEPLDTYFYRRDSETGFYPIGSGSLTWNLYTDEEAAEINGERPFPGV